MNDKPRPTRLSDVLGVVRCSADDCIALVPRGIEYCPQHAEPQ